MTRKLTIKPDGSVVARTVRPSTARIVLTDKYERSHMRRPRGEGSWLFRNVDTDQWVELGGRYGEVRRALPAGTWELLP